MSNDEDTPVEPEALQVDDKSPGGLGSAFRDEFAGCGLRDGEIEELRGQRVRPATFSD
jgi:hypothetical protein